MSLGHRIQSGAVRSRHIRKEQQRERLGIDPTSGLGFRTGCRLLGRRCPHRFQCRRVSFRSQRPPRPLLGGRQTICDFLWETVERESKIQVRFSTSVQSFQQENDGTVTGVVTDIGVLPTAKVILASGAFGASQESPSTSQRW